jgi:hypothetical protein
MLPCDPALCERHRLANGIKTSFIKAPGFVTLARIGVELLDADDVADWLAAAQAEAVLVRPDHVVFGVGRTDTLLAMLDEHLGLAELVG